MKPMHFPKRLACPLFFCALLAACGKPDLEYLPGTWQAVAWTDNEMAEMQTMEVLPMAINFQDDKRYSAQLLDGEPEAGRYYTIRNNLYVTDTTVEKPAEKKVQIARLTQDSLYLRFGAQGAHNILVFAKRQ